MAGIALDRVSKRFADGTVAVNDVSLSIADGEFFILVGPSGCGKSTLLNMIVGLEDVSAGEIRVDEQRVNEVDPKDRNMAMVFQSYALYPHMSVRENIAFPLKLARLSASDIDRRVAKTAAMLGLGELLERQLSDAGDDGGSGLVAHASSRSTRTSTSTVTGTPTPPATGTTVTTRIPT